MRLHGHDGFGPLLTECFGGSLPARYDLVAIPGGLYGLVRGDTHERQVVMSYIDLLVDLHQSETIAVIPHTDCGRYGLDRIGGKEDVLLADLAETRQELERRFPRLKVLTGIAECDALRTTRVYPTEGFDSAHRGADAKALRA